MSYFNQIYYFLSKDYKGTHKIKKADLKRSSENSIEDLLKLMKTAGFTAERAEFKNDYGRKLLITDFKGPALWKLTHLNDSCVYLVTYEFKDAF
jgi:hypothetical protein